MARLISLGAEEGTIRGVRDYATLSGSANVVGIGNSDNVIPRTGDYMYYTVGSSGLTIPAGSGNATAYYGLAIYPVIGNLIASGSGYGYWLNWALPTIHINNYAGNAYVYRSTTQLGSTFPMTMDRWTYLEIYLYVHASSGTITIKADGTQVYTFTGNTGASADVGNLALTGGSETSAQRVTYYDDIVVNNTSGGANNSYPGQSRLFPIKARGNGDNTDMTRKGVDLGYNYSQIRNANSIDWNQAAASGDYDLYTMDALVLPAGASVANVIVESHARSVGGGNNVKNMVKTVSTEYRGTSTSVGSNWTMVQECWNVNPNTSAAWTQGQLDALQIGVEMV